MKRGFKGKSFHPSPPKRRSKSIQTIGVAIKINDPSDSKLEGSPSNWFNPTPIHPQEMAAKLNMATFLKVFDLVFTGGITKRENEVRSIALVFSELRKGMER